ncbi:hypothetical protein JTB14_017077 [Gonioctena quinquepunctata]|nr:hypothetical protein JTB14_017077 [Gonioctena quinquepunctata]
MEKGQNSASKLNDCHICQNIKSVYEEDLYQLGSTENIANDEEKNVYPEIYDDKYENDDFEDGDIELSLTSLDGLQSNSRCHYSLASSGSRKQLIEKK